MNTIRALRKYASDLWLFIVIVSFFSILLQLASLCISYAEVYSSPYSDDYTLIMELENWEKALENGDERLASDAAGRVRNSLSR